MKVEKNETKDNTAEGGLEPPAEYIVSIDELVLEGFAPSEKYRIGDAVERELVRLFSEWARTKELQAVPAREVVDAGTFPMNSSRGDVVGAQIAQSVFENLQSKE